MISERLRELVDGKYSTRVRAAQALGISQPYLSDVLNGRKGLSAELAAKFSDVFGVRKIEDLLIQQTRSEFEKARQEAKRK